MPSTASGPWNGWSAPSPACVRNWFPRTVAWVAEALVRRSGLNSDVAIAPVQALSQEFGVTDNQLSVALHRAKQRLRELILEEIRDSVASAEEASEEVNDMFRALRHPGDRSVGSPTSK